MEPALIVSIVCAILTAVVGPVCVLLVKSALAKKEKDAQEAKEKEEQWRNEVRNLIAPVAVEVTEIKRDLDEDKEATILNLRCQMKSILDKCRKEGFIDHGDKATFNELYNKYTKMGGNHFIEFVDEWKDEIEELPIKAK